MPYVLFRKATEFHRWTYTVHSAQGDQLDAGDVYATCRWPLRWLPFGAQRRSCRDRHAPTRRTVNSVLMVRGWLVDVDREAPHGATALDVRDLFACPRCGNYARVEAFSHVMVQPDRIGELPAACVGIDSCGWTGTRGDTVGMDHDAVE